MSNDVVEVLTKARALVERGRTQRVVTALLAVCGGEAGPSYIAARDSLCRALGMPETFGYVSVWNDAPERTQAEVVDAFDRAIAAEVARVSE